MLNPMDDLEGKFVIRDEDKLLEFDRCGDLPDTFDHLIKFEPTKPAPPVTIRNFFIILSLDNLNKLF